jgi:predicted urease superfamily metal-dependent hydrolase
MNQVAQQIEIEKSLEYDFSLVPADRLSLRKSANRSGGRERIEDIYYRILNKDTNLWVVFDTGNLAITGAQVTFFNIYPTGKKMLSLDHTGGKNMQDWVEKGIEVMTKFAKENGCEGIEGVGRHGQWNWVKNKKGWKRPASMYEYNFEENQ